jgi:DNA-binding IclR family transcriptional regulator
MTLQGIQLDILQTLVNIQAATSLDEVEDVYLAEEVEIDLNVVRSLLETLAQGGYVQLDRTETITGMVYSATATSMGRVTVADSQRQVSERL